MEFKVYPWTGSIYCDFTEWNLKVNSYPSSGVGVGVDIATEWNLKKAEEQVLQTKNKVDIETEWNLKN